MSMYHKRPTVADMRAMKGRGQKISMLYVTNLEEAAAAAAAGINMLSIEGRFMPSLCSPSPQQKKVEPKKDNLAQCHHIPKRKNPNLRR